MLGVQKAGTTSLHNQLQTHPMVVGPIELKECHFFDKISDLNPEKIAAYERLFYPKWLLRGRLTFESTPKYIYLESAMSLLHEYAPSAKFILVLREPSERAFSQWSMQRWAKNRSNVKVHGRPFDECISDLTHEYVTRGYYADQLKVFLRYFSATQLHIIDFNKYISKNAEVMDGVCEFLAISKFHFEPTHSYKRIKDTQDQYEESLTKLRKHYVPMNADLQRMLSDVWGVSMSWLDPGPS